MFALRRLTRPCVFRNNFVFNPPLISARCRQPELPTLGLFQYTTDGSNRFPPSESCDNSEQEEGQSGAEDGPDFGKREVSDAFRKIMQDFFESRAVRERARRDLGLETRAFRQMFKAFATSLKASISLEMFSKLLSSAVGKATQDTLMPLFFDFVEDVQADLRATADLRLPFEWYPHARKIQRTFVYHVGPPNSGKTHSAIERLASADKGVYCAPLRMLANEVYHKLNDRGVLCNLMTGQEEQIIPGAGITACTTEMVNVSLPVDVVVLDEVQLIGDRERGSAWTKVILGINSPEIHLCGDASALSLLAHLCSVVGDTLTVKQYKRYSELEILESSLGGDITKVERGDCVVTFSRKNIFHVKRLIEEKTSLRCCVVYGKLPPEIRGRQAKAFNDPESEFDVLVASDAVGMGLNLNIKRIVFHSLVKFDGYDDVLIPDAQIRQIAGRAGRYGTLYPDGSVTTLHEKDLAIVRKAVLEGRSNVDLEAVDLKQLSTLEGDVDAVVGHEQLFSAGLFPSFELISKFSNLCEEERFSRVLDQFSGLAQLEGVFFFCHYVQMLELAKQLDHVPLELEDRYTFCCSPANPKNQKMMRMFLDYAIQHADGRFVPIGTTIDTHVPGSIEELEKLEDKHYILDLYMWLSYRFPTTFLEGEKCEHMRTTLQDLIQSALESPFLAVKRIGSAPRPNQVQRAREITEKRDKMKVKSSLPPLKKKKGKLKRGMAYTQLYKGQY